MPRLRTILAFLLAPLPLPLLLSVIFFPPEPTVKIFLLGILFWSIMALPQAYLCEIVLGIPAWILLRGKIRGWIDFAVGGAVLGTIYWVLYDIARYAAAEIIKYNFVEHPFTRDLNPLSILVAAPAGLASAIVFRAIVFPRQQNNPPRPAT